jgi:uncharacterized membrane protein YqjE
LAAENGNENLARAVTDVSDRVTTLVREEIELAKAEVSVKVKSLTRGIVWFVLAAVLAFFGVIFVPVTIAWVLDYELISGVPNLWIGFLIVMGAFFLLTGLRVILGVRKLKAGAPPTPSMAIDEAKKIRATVSTKSEA